MTGGATIATALAETAVRLAAAGIDEPRADAEVLLAHTLDTDRAGLVVRAGQPLPDGLRDRFEALVRRRLRREPVCQLVGRREFWSLDLDVDRRVLSPRPESELLVETVLALAPRAGRVLDCGTGSGALAAALARELPAATVIASDRAADTLAVAEGNLRRLSPAVRIVRGHWLTAFRDGVFDVVVVNPPYVQRGALAALPPEVRDYEPRLALDGGLDGLDAIRVLLATGRRVLAPRGWLVLELGGGQAPDAVAVATAAGWDAIEVRRDHAGTERVLAARRPGGGGA
jgi:release factor glutamine methyltransferase